MPNLSQKLINDLYENKTDATLVIEGSPDLGGLLARPFEAALYEGLKDNASVKNIIFKDTNKRTMEILGSVFTRIKYGEKIESIGFHSVHFDSISFFVAGLSVKELPTKKLKLMNLESDAIDLFKPLLIDRRDELLSLPSIKPTALYISHLDKLAIHSVTNILFDSNCKIKVLSIENISDLAIPDLIAALEMGLMHKLQIQIGLLESPALDLVCKEILAKNLKVAFIHLPEKSELESVNILKAEIGEKKKRPVSAVASSEKEKQTQVAKKQMVVPPSQLALPSGAGSPQFFSPADAGDPLLTLNAASEALAVLSSAKKSI